MLELADSILTSLDDGRRLAVATVVEVDGSAPRALGTSMAVGDDGRVIGSISGGCVEGAVYDACIRVLESGESELCEFGFSDQDAFAVGLSCGGRLRVIVQELAPVGSPNAVPDALRDELEAARAGRAAGIALVIDGSTDAPGDSVAFDDSASPAEAGPVGAAPHGFESLGPGGERRAAVAVRLVTTQHAAAGLERVATELRSGLHGGRPVRRAVECADETVEAVLLVSAPPPRLIVFGAVDFSVALSNAAALLGYRVTVCDARPVFATPERFPAAEVVNRWPTDYLASTEVDERTVICILTHDDKFDVPLIEASLALPVAYVGAMGSRRTHERRIAALRERGLEESVLASLHSPIGLDLGASSPEETAVSILAEVLAVRNGGSGERLRSTRGAIHRVPEPLVTRGLIGGEAE